MIFSDRIQVEKINYQAISILDHLSTASSQPPDCMLYVTSAKQIKNKTAPLLTLLLDFLCQFLFLPIQQVDKNLTRCTHQTDQARCVKNNIIFNNETVNKPGNCIHQANNCKRKRNIPCRLCSNRRSKSRQGSDIHDHTQYNTCPTHNFGRCSWF